MIEERRHPSKFPYSLNPDTLFHLETIPVFGLEERVDFFFKYKRQTENLYVGSIDKSKLFFNNASGIHNEISQYFENRYFLNSKEEIIEHQLKRITFPKLCWLTDSFFKTGFKFPISVHYNPRVRQNVAHPGTGRNAIINFFQEDGPVKCLYFNTGGVRFDFVDNMDVFSKEELLSFKETLELELVADHGSIIPHINLNVPPVWTGIKKWQDFVYRRITSSSFTVFVNKPVTFLNSWLVPESQANIKIYFHKTPDDRSICKSVILAILGKAYASESFTIEHTLSFSTPD